jgi:DNA-binding response OmpR family regulator
MNAAAHESVLLIEDEPLLAMDVEMTLSAAGYRVVGPAQTNAAALAMLRAERPDLIILDLNLGAEMVFPVFDYLDVLGTPFIIVSGHSRHLIPTQHRDRPFLQKPYDTADLLRMVHETLAAANGASVFKDAERRVND